MTQTLARTQRKPESLTVEQALVQGDLAGLDSEQRVNYLLKVCSSLGLNPLTRPFDFLILNGKTILYARKDATDQLRKIHKVSITRLEREQLGDLMVVTATAALPDGRTDSAIGAVSVKGLAGEALANALMKSETKAKRRVTLSLCGLGMTDESEVDSIPGAYLPEALDTSSTPRDDVPVICHDSVPVKAPGMVTDANEKVVQRWLQLVEEAEQLGIEVAAIDLPIAHSELVRRGRELLHAIDQRQAEIDQDQAEVERQRRDEGLVKG